MITVDFKRLDIKPGFRILDVGCGSGRHLGEAVRFKDVIAVGVDLCFDDLKLATGRLNFHHHVGQCHAAWGVAVSDAGKLPFPDESLDLVICSEVLEHIVDHRVAAAELMRLIKPGGGLVISVPRYGPEKICWMLSREYRSAAGGHVRIYRKDEVRDLFREAGAVYLERHYSHGLHSPFWWLKCLAGLNRNDFAPVRLYHRFLVWDMMKRPWLTRGLEKLLNPLIGKSEVFYFGKPD